MKKSLSIVAVSLVCTSAFAVKVTKLIDVKSAPQQLVGQCQEGNGSGEYKLNSIWDVNFRCTVPVVKKAALSNLGDVGSLALRFNNEEAKVYDVNKQFTVGTKGHVFSAYDGQNLNLVISVHCDAYKKLNGSSTPTFTCDRKAIEKVILTLGDLSQTNLYIARVESESDGGTGDVHGGLDIGSSGGYSQTGFPGYYVEEKCNYNTGCTKMIVYHGPTTQQCNYNTGCVDVPLYQPRTKEVCNYNTGCHQEIIPDYPFVPNNTSNPPVSSPTGGG